MDLTHWINRRLKPDQARHAVMTAALAVVFAHLSFLDGMHLLVGEAWIRALWAGVVMSLWELVQKYRGTGVADWNDVAANFGGAGLVALATLA